ncbi:two-component response regulator ARR-A family [Senna tora]|uniref:Two-component response regulator ARR-A family n=1 Tax=Senna tora TaxID=362788 RepID=A0A834SI86_9FABA|nr:two-component response regulator ARR-A family [Senna tora]
MSSGSDRRVSREDIQLVQNLIERCLQLYMNQKEVVKMLLDQAKIEPGFTELVWQKLEEENQEFFRAYYLRLVVKQQITEFNRLLEQQMHLMNQLQPTAVASLPNSNGSHIPALHQNPACYAAEHAGGALKPENMQHSVGSGLPNVFNNDGSSLHTTMHAAVEMSAHANRIDAPPSLLSAQNSNMGLIQGINGGMIKSEPGFSRSSPYMFGAGNSVLEPRQTIGDTSGTSFTSVESNSQSLNDALLDADVASYGFLGQVPRNFSLSDLTADFSQSSDILESYSRSPFLATDENFLDRGEQGEINADNKRLDSISEGLSYEDFGSD